MSDVLTLKVRVDTRLLRQFIGMLRWMLGHGVPAPVVNWFLALRPPVRISVAHGRWVWRHVDLNGRLLDA